MPLSFYPRLVNGPFQDPGLFLPFAYEKRAFIFDLGDISALSSRDALKISHGFVTHTHMDHFIGFDSLLRLFLGRSKTLHLFGPEGFLNHVEGKLAGYRWNLVKNYAEGFVLKATEVRGKRRFTRTYPCQKRFRASTTEEEGAFTGALLEEPTLTVSAVELDHQIPCLGFVLEERFHVNIKKGAVESLGMTAGPWLTRFKNLLCEGHPGETIIEADTADGRLKKRFELRELEKKIAMRAPGQKIVYIADVIGTDANMDRIVAAAAGADHLFIEAAFLDRERDVAYEKYHLTARQAGDIAGRAGVKQFTLFHYSPRYMDATAMIEQEAQSAYQRHQPASR